MVRPVPGQPVVVPTPAHAVRVSDDTCAAVERLLGYSFKSQATLREAMSHASMDEETRAAAGLGARNNERLEWLGDGAFLGGKGAGGLVGEYGEWMGKRRLLVCASLSTSFMVLQGVLRCVAAVLHLIHLFDRGLLFSF